LISGGTETMKDMKLTQKLLKQYKNGGKKMKGQIISEYGRLIDVSKTLLLKDFVNR
jgi:hypothetical protein